MSAAREKTSSVRSPEQEWCALATHTRKIFEMDVGPSVQLDPAAKRALELAKGIHFMANLLHNERADRPHAIGESPEHALERLGQIKGWGSLENFREFGEDEADEKAVAFDWGRTFRADGISMKAAGVKSECGMHAVTWWK